MPAMIGEPRMDFLHAGILKAEQDFVQRICVHLHFGISTHEHPLQRRERPAHSLNRLGAERPDSKVRPVFLASVGHVNGAVTAFAQQAKHRGDKGEPTSWLDVLQHDEAIDERKCSLFMGKLFKVLAETDVADTQRLAACTGLVEHRLRYVDTGNGFKVPGERNRESADTATEVERLCPGGGSEVALADCECLLDVFFAGGVEVAQG